ncbi:MAG: InlB B-repeat-containing protein, partial [Oscillospiraceae bacterium]
EKTGVKATDKGLLPAAGATTKAGYHLTGWKHNNTVVTDTTAYSALSTTETTLTLTAQWAAKSYTIQYTPDNGGSIPDITKSWSESGLLPTQPTKTGHTFDGWYYGGAKVTATTSVSELIPQDDRDKIMLTAKWSERTYTVNYNSDGGTTFPQKNNVKYTAAGLLPDVSPVKLGYSFDGWKCGEKPVTATTVCNTLLVKDTDSGITLVAQWKAKTGFTVQYDTDGGTPKPTAKTVAWADTNLLPADTITKSGYTPNGWLSGRKPVTDATAFSALAQSDQPGTSVTLVAQWTEKSNYKVTYNTDGGSTVADKIALKWTNNNLIPPAPPTKSGYAFVEWQCNNVKVIAADSYGSLAKQDTVQSIILDAVWISVADNTVRYDTAGGTVISDRTGVKVTDTNL